MENEETKEAKQINNKCNTTKEKSKQKHNTIHITNTIKQKTTTNETRKKHKQNKKLISIFNSKSWR